MTGRMPLLLLVCLTSVLDAQQTLTLTNGDRLTGTLRRIADGTWTFRVPFGDADAMIPADQIAAFAAPEPIGVRLTDGTIAAVTVRPAPASQSLTLTFEDGSTRQVAPTAFAAVGAADALAALEPEEIGIFTPFARFWGATGSVGFSDKSGNSRAQGTAIALEIRRRAPRDRIKFTAGITQERSEDANGDLELTVSKFYGSLRTDVFFTSRLFTFVETRQERDTFQDIDLRSTYNGGLGVQIVTTPTTDLSFSGSGGTRVENFTSGGSETVAVLRSGADFRQRLGPATFDWALSFDPRITDFSDFQFRSQASVTTTVYKGLGVRLGLLNEVDGQPRPGVEKHDMLVTTTLTYSIGQ